MTEMRTLEQIKPGLVELTTSKNVEELKQNEDVVLIDDSDEEVRVLVDLSKYMEDDPRYLY